MSRWRILVHDFPAAAAVVAAAPAAGNRLPVDPGGAAGDVSRRAVLAPDLVFTPDQRKAIARAVGCRQLRQGPAGLGRPLRRRPRRLVHGRPRARQA